MPNGHEVKATEETKRTSRKFPRAEKKAIVRAYLKIRKENPEFDAKDCVEALTQMGFTMTDGSVIPKYFIHQMNRELRATRKLPQRFFRRSPSSASPETPSVRQPMQAHAKQASQDTFLAILTDPALSDRQKVRMLVVLLEG